MWGSARSGGQNTLFVPYGDFGTWQESGCTVVAWTANRGAYRFIDYSSDPSRAANALATDGTDMVWVESEGKEPGMDFYPIRSIVTAPFTTDPEELVPRRLRSFPTPYPAITPFAVGCGYAGYGYEPGKVLIVRIEDGFWWELPSTGCTPPNFVGDFCFETVYAISCDEIFLQGGIPMNIARVELSALGPPNPPD